MIEMYLAGVSTKRIEDVSEILQGIERVGGDGFKSKRVSTRCRRGMARQAARLRLAPTSSPMGLCLKRSQVHLAQSSS